MIGGAIMEAERGIPEQKLHAAYRLQSIEDSKTLEARIIQAQIDNEMFINIMLTSTDGSVQEAELEVLPVPVEKFDIGNTYVFLLLSGDHSDKREVSISIPPGGGRALIVLPFQN